MTVYVYRETNDNMVFGGETVLVYASVYEAKSYLRSRVEAFFGKPWEECEEIVDEDDGDFFDTYVRYPNGDGDNYFAIDGMEVIE